KRAAQAAFGSKPFSKIQQAAGDEPSQFVKPGRSRDEFFQVYGRAVRKLGMIPTQADWNHHKIKPTPSAYTRTLGIPWKELPYTFREWTIDKSEWEDVVAICEAVCPPLEYIDDKSSAMSCGYVYLIKSGRFYKIGRTNSPGRRGYELKLQLPEETKRLHLIKTDDPVGVEAYWHNRFKLKRKNGEFFTLSADDVRAFKRWKSIF
ncbi:MAG: GIY-YIG nuclease family protein, partial [Pirellulales bacterium]|nr:GIY-YIG nuclease family protein [Pirellulales bacterium]